MRSECVDQPTSSIVTSQRRRIFCANTLFGSDPLNKTLALQILVRLLVEHITLAVLKLLDLVLLGALGLATLDSLPDYRAE